MAEIVPVTSEALEAQIRNLLPSQRGFGEDLQATNVITPVIDLTAAAQGTQVPEILQTAINFGGNTAFALFPGTSTSITTTGFWRITAQISLDPTSGSGASATISQSDGITSKNVYNVGVLPEADPSVLSHLIDLVFFNAAGITLTLSAASLSTIYGSYRQIADVNGNLVNPAGFNPQ